MITIITASTDAQLTTTAAVQQLLGQSTANTSDHALLDDLITRASRWAETFVGRPLSAAAYRETLAGYGGRRLPLSRRPLRAVTGFWDATDTGSATTMLSSEYALDREAGFFERDRGWAWDAPGISRPFAYPLGVAYFPGEERRPWLADYVAGYTYAGMTTDSDLWSTAHGTTSTGRTLPEDIEDAVARRAANIYEGDEDMVERSVGDLRVKYATAGQSGQRIDPAAELLRPYVEVA